VENQPSPSLISLSPLTNSLPRALRRAWVEPSGLASFGLLLVRSLGFGCSCKTYISSYGRLADPLYKRYAVACYDDPLIVHFLIWTPFTLFINKYFFNFPSQYYFSIAHPIFNTLEVEPPSSAKTLTYFFGNEIDMVKGFGPNILTLLSATKVAATRSVPAQQSPFSAALPAAPLNTRGPTDQAHSS